LLLSVSKEDIQFLVVREMILSLWFFANKVGDLNHEWAAEETNVPYFSTYERGNF